MDTSPIFLSVTPRRRLHLILIGLTLLTLPCYCAGFLAISRAPERNEATATATLSTILETPTATLGQFTPTIPSSPTNTYTPTQTLFAPTYTLTPTSSLIPTQTATITLPPTETATLTVPPPTNTPTITLSPTP